MMNTELQSEDRKEALAAEADARIKNSAHWNDWMYIADGFAVGRTKALRAAGTNSPHGKAYNRIFGEWLAERPWAKRYDKGTRSNLLWCADHRSEIEEWRSKLAQNERDKLNHPTNARRKYEAAHKKVESPDEPKKETAKDSLVRENEELWARLKGMEAERDEVRAAYEANEGVIEDTLSALMRKDAKTIGVTIVRQLISNDRVDHVWEIRAAIDHEITAHQNSEWKKAREAEKKVIQNKAKNRAKKPKAAVAEEGEAGGFAPGTLEQIARDLRAAGKRKSKSVKQAAE
jgi:hypothetical protein